MNRKLLAVFAHPDDESFGPGGTLAKYAKEGVEIHVLCVTRGEAGKKRIQELKNLRIKEDTGTVRESELITASKVLGVKKVEFLNFIDGELCNNVYHELAGQINKKITSFKPQVILTFENNGVSGHLDHVALSLVTTFAFLRQKIARKLYYYCLMKERAKLMKDYFIYFPPGYTKQETSVVIDVSKVWDIKVKAMKKHQSQIHDVNRILTRFKNFPKEENFILFNNQDGKFGKTEKDFFAGI